MGRAAKGILAAAICAALLLALAVSASGSASTAYYLMAVNDKAQPETTPENAPVVISGMLHVPYTMFSSKVTGVNLGVSAQYNAARGTVMVYAGRQGVTFDIRNNTAADIQGNPVDARAVVRGSMVFLPLDWVCSYFSGVSYTLIRTGYCTLVRVTNSSVILSDAEFVDAAGNMLRENLRSYQEALDALSAAESSAPEPSPSAAASAQPVPSQPAVEEPEAQVYLAFRWGERAADMADRLEGSGQRALFLFTVEELETQDDLVRRLTAAGHTIGLALTGSSADSCLAQAEAGRGMLGHMARCAVQIVSADSLDEEGRQALSSAGYVLWSANVQGDRAASGQALLQAVRSSRINYVELTCGERGYTVLSAALRSLTGSGYRLDQAVAPVLQ